jgi:uncharacterized protein (DUF39 family)
MKIKIMKNLIPICFLLFFALSGNAQVNNKTNFKELNQDQLNLALAQSLRTIKTGKTLTIIGGSVFIVGYIISYSGINGALTDNSDNLDKNLSRTIGGALLATGGGIVAIIGIPIWITSANRKDKIEIELVKFNPKGSASINGIGLKIRF